MSFSGYYNTSIIGSLKFVFSGRSRMPFLGGENLLFWGIEHVTFGELKCNVYEK